jgi:hypothetical protein
VIIRAIRGKLNQYSQALSLRSLCSFVANASKFLATRERKELKEPWLHVFVVKNRLSLDQWLIKKGAVGAFFCAVLCGLAAPERTAAQGWGIDACLTRHVSDDQFLPYEKLLAGAGFRIVRERDVGTRHPDGSYEHDIRPKCRAYHEAGFFVIAFAGSPLPLQREQGGDVLPEDLLAVYNGGKLLAHDFAGLVDAWEMVGEPDVGYCTDLPERTVAYQKALYLGIKAGAREAGAPAPLVLMGALALPPGPWLERAAKNGLLDYTDAYNFHFYGYAEELTDVIKAHRAFLAQHQRDCQLGQSIKAQRRNAAKSDTIQQGILATRDRKDHIDDSEISSLSSMSSFVANPSESLPLWITECGLNAVKPDDFLNVGRRKLQADFTVATAQQALASPDVAVFMPFILVENHDPYALTLASDRPLPAWTAYAQFIHDHPWPAIRLQSSAAAQGKPLLSESNTLNPPTVSLSALSLSNGSNPPAVSLSALSLSNGSNPLVLQWMPDNATTLPHKVSGTYRFIGNGPIKGEIRLYNFSDKPVSGRLQITAGPAVQIEHTRDWYQTSSLSSMCSFVANTPDFLATPLRSSSYEGQARDHMEHTDDSERLSLGSLCSFVANPSEFLATNVITIAAGSRVSVPIEFCQAQPGTYIRENFSAVFIEDDGRESPLSFGLESIPTLDEFTETPLGLKPLASAMITEPGAKNFRPGDRMGVWTTVNGLRVAAVILATKEHIEHIDKAQASSLGSLCSLVANPSEAFVARFWTPAIENDPIAPTLAAARLDGLPSEGFLRLQLDRPMGREAKVRLDLIDDRQQRFTIWENLGIDYYGSRNDLWLNLKDFHIYFWGPCSENPRFNPASVRELQLRFYFAKANDPLAVRLSLLQPK